ncbi:MAG: RagB/SusD family nutrient uptake outer membrane protein [Bacteroidales bacterium]|nr:RagB/SusD family nutrient uptake outer membrane protein [Bacteroidales bacterium]
MNTKYISIMMSLATAMIVCGCNDDAYLEEDPKTIFTMENAFEKPAQVDDALAMAYDRFNSLNGYGNGFVGGADGNFFHGDGSDVLDGTQGQSSASGAFSNYWALTSTNGNFLNTWNALYRLGASANLALYGAGQIESSENPYLIAQARFFRGWAYLRLAEMFGGVPIVKEFDSSLKFDYGRASRKETYEFAIDDLKAAVADLPEFPKQDGRLSRGLANHILAEAYLAIGVETGDSSYYDLAVTAADDVISKHPLMMERFGSRSEKGTQPSGVPDNGVERYRADGNVFYDLFQIGNYNYSEGNTESLGARQTPSYEQSASYGGGAMPLGITIGPPYRDIIWKVGSGIPGGGSWQQIDPTEYIGGGGTFYLGGLSWGMISTTNYVDEYIWRDQFADDIRNDQINLCDPVVMNATSEYKGQRVKPEEVLEDPSRYSRISSKMAMQDLWGWDIQHSSMFGTPFTNQWLRDWYIARSAETYLLRAEAKLRKGDKAGAAADINKLRERAHASYMYSADEIDIYTILDERARELSWEEMRWPTLLRMGGNGKNEVMHHQLEKFSKHCFDDGVFAGKTFPEWTLFAIPFSVINLNKDNQLQQNPGWN